MRALRLLALVGVFGTAAVPAAAQTLPAAMAQHQVPTKQQLETAVKAANPTIGQLSQLRKLEPSIKSMTPAQLKQALGQIFSPEQLVTILQSLQGQGLSLPH